MYFDLELEKFSAIILTFSKLSCLSLVIYSLRRILEETPQIPLKISLESY
jgi:hypothetical protein